MCSLPNLSYRGNEFASSVTASSSCPMLSINSSNAHFISLVPTDFGKRVYQGVRVKHTVKDLLAEKRSRQSSGSHFSVSHFAFHHHPGLFSHQKSHVMQSSGLKSIYVEFRAPPMSTWNSKKHLQHSCLPQKVTDVSLIFYISEPLRD